MPPSPRWRPRLTSDLGLRVDAPLEKLQRLQALRRRLAELNALDRERYRTDIGAWARDRLGVHLWSKQVEIAESVVRNRRTAVQSAAGIGKSLLAAVTALWWIDTHPPGEAIVVTTAPDAELVYTVLWEEIRKYHVAAKLDGTVQRGQPIRWVLDDGTLVGLGRKPADHSTSSFQGIHRRYVLVILDEAGGCKQNLWVGAEAITTNEDCRVLAIGNPDDNSSHFAGICNGSNLWHTIKVSALESPNVTGEDVPHEMRMVLPSAQQIEDLKTEWGEDNPLYIAKVLGEFADATDGLIPLSWILDAQSRWREWNAGYDGTQQPGGRFVFGVDVANKGEDKTCIATRKGHVVMKIERFSKFDTVEVTNLVTARMDGLVEPVAVVDADGLGIGVADLLRHRGYSMYPYHGGSTKAIKKMMDRSRHLTFRNTRSAAWFNVRELLDPAFEPTLCIPDDNKLAAELASPKWPDVAGNVVQLESKQEIIARLGNSPDSADAAVQSLWYSRIQRHLQSEPAVELQPVAYAEAVGGWD